VSAMYHKTLSALSVAAVLGLAAYTPLAQAFNFGDMMNPGRWMGGDRDRYDNDDSYDGPYGGGPWGGPGYGGYGGYPGYGYGGYPGYGGGYPGYGYGGYPSAGYGFPGYGAAPPVAPAPAAAPAQSRPADNAEIDALKRRIEELESAQRPPQKPAAPAPSGDWPASPAFRPMNQY
jgi:hypothetical protein